MQNKNQLQHSRRPVHYMWIVTAEHSLHTVGAQSVHGMLWVNRPQLLIPRTEDLIETRGVIDNKRRTSIAQPC
jgi:hypothetical protein